MNVQRSRALTADVPARRAGDLAPTEQQQVGPILRDIVDQAGAGGAFLLDREDGGGFRLICSEVRSDHRDGHVGAAALKLEPGWLANACPLPETDLYSVDVETRGERLLRVSLWRPTAAFQRLRDLGESSAFRFLRLWQQFRQLHSRKGALEAAINGLGLGVLILTRGARIVHANRVAERMLAIGEGLQRTGDFARPTHLSDGVQFQAALSHIFRDEKRFDGQHPLLTFRRHSAPPLVAALSAMPRPASCAGDPLAVMYLREPCFDVVGSITPLCHLHGLSPVETTLACHLVAGLTLCEAAKQMHVKEQTARSYLKQMFVKTATNRQTELVVLLLSRLIRMDGDIAAGSAAGEPVNR